VVELVATDVHWPERDVLVIEFEVPLDAFELPVGSVDVRLLAPDGTRRQVRGEVVPEQSGHAGPNRAGTLVRLAIRLTRGQAWSAGSGAELTWTSRALDANGNARKFGARLYLEVPHRSPDQPA
jgi:hypothetical protein